MAGVRAIANGRSTCRCSGRARAVPISVMVESREPEAFRGCSAQYANHERNRTAQLGNRDKHGPRRLLGPEPAVSGSDALGLDAQDPAESQRFLRRCRSASEKSPQPQTEWRREWDSNPRYLSVATVNSGTGFFRPPSSLLLSPARASWVPVGFRPSSPPPGRSAGTSPPAQSRPLGEPSAPCWIACRCQSVRCLRGCARM